MFGMNEQKNKKRSVVILFLLVLFVFIRNPELLLYLLEQKNNYSYKGAIKFNYVVTGKITYNELVIDEKRNLFNISMDLKKEKFKVELELKENYTLFNCLYKFDINITSQKVQVYFVQDSNSRVLYETWKYGNEIEFNLDKVFTDVTIEVVFTLDLDFMRTQTGECNV